MRMIHSRPSTDMKLVIEPGRAVKNYWTDLWKYRELMYFLAWRDIAVRYKQTVIGIAWALIRPALTMLVFVAFRRMVGIRPGSVPDPILVFAAVLPWQFFSTTVSEAAGSLIGNANLISKVYFPRILIPCAAIVPGLVDLLIMLGLLCVLMLWYGFAPGWQIVALPAFIVLASSLSVGLGLLLSALNVEYRDFRYIIPFMLQFGIFVSPVAYSSGDVPARWQAVYALNPLVGIIDGFRWAILGGSVPWDSQTFGLSVAVTGLFLVLGVWYFRRMERSFADVI
jgi:lipopolysaccharide transport system permease protein